MSANIQTHQQVRFMQAARKAHIWRNHEAAQKGEEISIQTAGLEPDTDKSGNQGTDGRSGPANKLTSALRTKAGTH